MPIPSFAFLIDVDNTLLDNDRVKVDEEAYLERMFGPELASRFWDIYEQVRQEEDVVDYPLTLARFTQATDGQVSKEQLAALANFLLSFPFHEHLYPGTLETLAFLGRLGTTAITSDGDASFQGLKIARSGISAAVEGRVVLYLHKEQHLAEIQALFPAEHYVVIDDKARLLSAQKAQMGRLCTTVHVRQGKYAQVAPAPGELPPDLSVASIAAVQHISAEQFRAG